MLQDSPTPIECPLCMEEFDMDDKSFFPCTCGYQICRFCWHRIKSESQLEVSPTCPACRKPYSDCPANFKPAGDIRKKGKKMKVNKKQLQELRVVQKNLIFVVGLSPRIAEGETLKRIEYFGKFGKIVKVVVNQPREPASTGSAYITYAKSEDALRALTSVNNAVFDNKTIKANLGTTKYCSHFLRNSACPKSECMYLHTIGEPEASFTKEDMTSGRHVDYERRLVEGFIKGEREKLSHRGRVQGSPSPLLPSDSSPREESPVLSPPLVEEEEEEEEDEEEYGEGEEEEEDNKTPSPSPPHSPPQHHSHINNTHQNIQIQQNNQSIQNIQQHQNPQLNTTITQNNQIHQNNSHLTQNTNQHLNSHSQSNHIQNLQQQQHLHSHLTQSQNIEQHLNSQSPNQTHNSQQQLNSNINQSQNLQQHLNLQLNQTQSTQQVLNSHNNLQHLNSQHLSNGVNVNDINSHQSGGSNERREEFLRERTYDEIYGGMNGISTTMESCYEAEFNPFGDTQKVFEELIQREVLEGEKLRQGLPPPGFHKVQDPWSSLDPAIIFSAPSPAPTYNLGQYNLGNSYQEQNYGGYYASQGHQSLGAGQMVGQTGVGESSYSRFNNYVNNAPPPSLLHQSYPPPGFHLHQLLPPNYNYGHENMS